MKLYTYIDRINLLHKLVQQRHTGTPEELSKRLGLSVSRLFRILDELKGQGAPIAYSRSLRTYYYATPYEINILISFKHLDKSE